MEITVQTKCKLTKEEKKENKIKRVTTPSRLKMDIDKEQGDEKRRKKE